MADDRVDLVHVDLSRQLRHPQRWRHRRARGTPAMPTTMPPRRPIRPVVPSPRSRRAIAARIAFVLGSAALLVALLLALVDVVPRALEWLVTTGLQTLR